MVRIVVLRLLESYFRHRWLYLLPIVIASAAGGLFVATTTPKYVASGQLYVENDSLLAALTSGDNAGSWWMGSSQVTTAELMELLSTKAFVRSAIQKTDLERNMSAGPDAIDDTITYFREALNIQPVSDKLVDITATSEDPNLAHQMVIATMDAYVQWKINTDYQESVAARTFFEALIQPYTDELEKARADLIAYMDQYPEPVRGERPPEEVIEIERLQVAVAEAQERLKSAQDNEENARLALAQSESVSRQTYLVIDQPEIPREPEVSLKSMLVDFSIFAAIGVFLCVAGIVGGALLDQSLRFPIDVRHGLSLPVLAMVPVAASDTPLPENALVKEQPQTAQVTASGELSKPQPQL